MTFDNRSSMKKKQEEKPKTVLKDKKVIEPKPKADGKDNYDNPFKPKDDKLLSSQISKKDKDKEKQTELLK